MYFCKWEMWIWVTKFAAFVKFSFIYEQRASMKGKQKQQMKILMRKIPEYGGKWMSYKKT